MAKEDKVNYLPSTFHLGTPKVLSEFNRIKDVLQMGLHTSSEYNLQSGKACSDGGKDTAGPPGKNIVGHLQDERGHMEAKCSGSRMGDGQPGPLPKACG